jgi:hypothetical protein
MDVSELIKRGYRALGLGADNDVLAMFDQLGVNPAQWVVRHLTVIGSRDQPASEVAAMELFGGLPEHYEVVGVEPRSWKFNRRKQRLMVSGRYRVRPRGSWEVLALPFAHVWYLAGGHVEKVVSLLDGIELRRLGPACPA